MTRSTSGSPQQGTDIRPFSEKIDAFCVEFRAVISQSVMIKAKHFILSMESRATVRQALARLLEKASQRAATGRITLTETQVANILRETTFMRRKLELDIAPYKYSLMGYGQYLAFELPEETKMAALWLAVVRHMADSIDRGLETVFEEQKSRWSKAEWEAYLEAEENHAPPDRSSAQQRLLEEDQWSFEAPTSMEIFRQDIHRLAAMAQALAVAAEHPETTDVMFMMADAQRYAGMVKPLIVGTGLEQLILAAMKADVAAARVANEPTEEWMTEVFVARSEDITETIKKDMALFERARLS